jgi:archaeosine synthase
MDFQVKKRYGAARIGEIFINNKKVITPNIIYLNTPRLKAPNFADILISNIEKKTQKPLLIVNNSIFSTIKNISKGDLQFSNYLVYLKDLANDINFSEINQNKKNIKNFFIITSNKDLIDESLINNKASFFIISNAYQLFVQHSKFVEYITELRRKIGYQKMIYVPCIGYPSNLALLTYMGIDFFDSISAILAARKNILLFSNVSYNKYELNEIPCSCPICNRFKYKPSELKFQQILKHNYYALFNEMKNVRNAIKQGSLRELLETRIRANPSVTAILRILERKYYNYLEERIPLVRKSQIIATSKDSLFRPEIKRFQERIMKRYRKPESTKILLLLPCSAKKPYSFSKSHKLFRERLNSLKNPYIVHELIITSPLGIVPRELDLIYPASSYDIPVIGIWDEDEKKIIRKLLQNYLEINHYYKIIIHLPEDIKKFIQNDLKDGVNTCVDDKPTSKKSLDKLLKELIKATDGYEHIKASNRKIENIKSIASYQLGNKLADSLIKDCNIKGKYPNLRIMYKNKQLGMFTQERGLISLTYDGGKRIVNHGKYWVKIYDDFILKGSVFAPGIKDSDEDIRIGDEVLVLKNNKLCAVGVALMNGIEMKESTHGEAVKTRHIR